MAYQFLSGGSVSAQDWHNATDVRQKQAQSSNKQTAVKVQQQAQKKKQQDDQAKNNSLFNKVKSFAKPIEEAAIGTAKATGNVASIPYDVAKTIPASLTHNKQAEQNASKKADKNIETAKSFLQFGPRAVVQVASSVPTPINRHPSENNVKAGKKAPAIVKAVLGNEPIPSLQNVYKTTKKQAGTPAAAGTLLATAASDALAFKGGHDSVVKTGEKVSGSVKAARGKDEAVNALHQQQVARSLFDLSQKLRPRQVASAAVDAPTRPTVTQSAEAATAMPTASKVNAVTFDHNSVVKAIQQHMNNYYKPAMNHPDEAFAHEHLTNNTSQALTAYRKRTKEVFGSENIVGGDDAKYAVPGMDASKSSAYHEPASQFAKGYYRHLLSDPKTQGRSVLITSGGTGAGKTSALKKNLNEQGINPKDYAAIIDTNLTNLHSATSRIEPALATGRPVKVQFVYREPVEAYQNGVIPRARTEGRAVTAAQHADTHAGSLEVIKQLADKYKDHPNVDIEIIDNSRGRDNSKPVTLDFLHDKSYTKDELEVKIHKLLDDQLSKGSISNEEHAIFKGQEADHSAVQPSRQSSRKSGPDLQTVESSGKQETQRQSQPQRQRRVVASSKEGIAPEATWYHGTNEKFDTFDSAKIGSATDDGMYGHGFYFSNDRAYAQQAPKGAGAKHVMEVNPGVQNPLDLNKFKTKQELADYLDMSPDALIQQEGGFVRPLNSQIRQFTSQVKEMGHDGVYVSYSKLGHKGDELVAFNAKKIQVAKTKTGETNVQETQKQNTTTPTEQSTATRTLKPSETAHMPEIAGYTHSEHLAQDYADMLRGQEQQARGGQLVKNADGSYKRITEHSRFYRDYYKEYGKPPTKADYLEQSKLELENGKDGIGAGEDYKKLLEREAKPVPRVQVESTVTDVPQGGSKVAQRIAKNLKDQYGELAQYDKVNWKDQAEKAVKLTANREELEKVISGEKPLPDGLRATALLTAITKDPVLAKDHRLLLRAAQSPLASEASYGAQELNLARELAQHNPIEAIKTIATARQKAYEKRTGKTVAKATSDEVAAIRAAKPKVRVQDWDSLIEDLKCR